MGGLGRLKLLDHQTHMLPHLRHLDLVGGHGFVEVFDGDFLKRQPAFQPARRVSNVLSCMGNLFSLILRADST